MSTVPEYIGKIIAFLNLETAWNKSIVGDITISLNKKNQTKDDIDSLVMAVTKKVETRLRETLAKHLGRNVPRERDHGIGLLDYAVDSHLIRSKNEPIYYLIYLILKEPRNSSHHTFPDYPFKTTAMVISEANEALQRIDTLIQPAYSSHLHTNYDPANKKINIKTEILKPNGTFLSQDQKVEVTLQFQNSVKTVPLTYGSVNTWIGEYDVRGVP